MIKKPIQGDAKFVAVQGNDTLRQSALVLAALFILVGLLNCTGGSRLLSERLGSTNERVKRSAFMEMNALDIASREKYLDIMKDTLRDKNPGNRLLAADSLGRMGPAAEGAIPDLIRILGDENDAVRLRAEKALAEVGEASIPSLIAALSHRDTAIRCGAADSLGMMGSQAKEAVSALAVLLADPDYAVSRRAATALGLIGPASVSALTQAARGGNSQTTDMALDAFSVLKADRRIVRELVQLMGNAGENSGVRAFAAKALGKMQEKAQEAIPDLAHAIADENNDVRNAAGWALAQIGPAAIPALRELLAGGNPEIRSGAVHALGSMGPAAENAIPALLQAMTDNDRIVRLEAISALEKTRSSSRGVVQALIRALDEDHDGFVRLSAARALKRIGTHDAKEAVRRFNKKSSME